MYVYFYMQRDYLISSKMVYYARPLGSYFGFGVVMKVEGMVNWWS